MFLESWSNFKHIMIMQFFWGNLFYLFGWQYFEFSVSGDPFYIVISYSAALVRRGLSTWWYFTNLACWVRWLESTSLFLLNLTLETTHAQCAVKYISGFPVLYCKSMLVGSSFFTIIHYVKHRLTYLIHSMLWYATVKRGVKTFITFFLIVFLAMPFSG